MKQKQFKFGEYGVCINPKVVAHLRYTDDDDNDRHNSIFSASYNGEWFFGYHIETASGSLRAQVQKPSQGNGYPTEYEAVVAAITHLRKNAVSHKMSREDIIFVFRLCDRALDEVSPKLF